MNLPEAIQHHLNEMRFAGETETIRLRAQIALDADDVAVARAFLQAVADGLYCAHVACAERTQAARVLADWPFSL